MLKIYFSLTLFVAVASFLIGLFVFLFNRKKILNIVWFILCVAISGWNLGYFFTMIPNINYEFALLSSRLSHASGILITSLFFTFTIIYLDLINKMKFQLLLANGLTLIIAFLCLKDFVVPYLEPKLFMPWYPVGKIGYLIYIFNFLFWVAYAHIIYFAKYKTLDGIKKNQVKYFVTGTIIGFFGGSNCFPLIFGIPFWPIASVLIIVYPFTTAYAMVKEHLFDFEVVIKRGLVFAGLFAAIVIVYATPLFLFQNIFQQTFRISQGISTTIAIVAIIFGYERLKKFLINTTDKFLFQKQYEYRQALMDLSKGMAQLLPLKTFLYLLVKNIVEIVRIEGGAGVVLDEHRKKYQVLTARGSFWENLKDREFSKDCLIASALENKSYLLKEEITDKRLKEEMEKLRIHFIIPSYFENKIIGFLILGEKKSQESYSLEDIDLFLTLAPQVAVSIQNCKLYGTEMEKREVAEEKVEIAQQEIERSSRLAALGTLAAGLAHEIRNPMTILRSRAEDLISEINNKQYLLEYSELSIKNIDRILKIVNNMLRFARTKETGQMPLEIDEVLNDTLTLLSSKIKNKGIQVIKEFRCGQKITGDASSLQQAFLNILLNSLDFMNEGGTLTIKTQLAGSEITIEISDTGHGIEEGNLERIFDPFYSTRSEGTGLGLAITYRIIQDQGGKIKVESQVGKGTRFLISLPAG